MLLFCRIFGMAVVFGGVFFVAQKNKILCVLGGNCEVKGGSVWYSFVHLFGVLVLILGSYGGVFGVDDELFV